MRYQFFPRKDAPCPNVGHCPHVGSAAIASLVVIGNENQLYLRQRHGTLDAGGHIGDTAFYRGLTRYVGPRLVD